MADKIKLILTALFISVGLPLLFLGFITILFITSSIEDPEQRIGFAFETAFGLLLFIILPIVIILVAYYLLKKQKKTINKSPTNNQSEVVNKNPNRKVGLLINPFKDIRWYLNTVRPEEEVVKKQKVLILYASDYWINFVIFISLLPNFLFTATLIETEKAYYLDKRRQNLFTLGIYLGIIIIVTIILSVIESTFASLMPIVILFYVLWFLFILLFPLNQIRAINKEWITEKSSDENKLVLVGNYPKNALRALNPYPFLSSFGSMKNSFRYSFKIKKM